MRSSSVPSVTGLLHAWSSGDRAALDLLISVLEQELRRIAHHHMRAEDLGHTLRTTALVNEAFIKLVDQSHATWQNRAHFLAVAAALMRRILLDHARGRYRVKRGVGVRHLPLDEELVFTPAKSSALIALDEALAEFTQLYPRQARVVELRYFGGLSVEETAEVLHIHPNTVIRDWKFAKAWLSRQLSHSLPASQAQNRERRDGG